MNKFESKYIKTSNKMCEALVSLLETKDFEYISIKEICSKANINRSTFYLHYETTRDLLEEVIDKLEHSFSESFLHESLDVNSPTVQSKDLFLITDKYLLPYLSFIRSNKKVFKAAIKNPNTFNLDKRYINMCDLYFVPILKRYGVTDEEQKYVLNFYINGIFSIIKLWIGNDCDMENEAISKIIKKCINYTL